MFLDQENIKIFASSDSWIESEAVEQLKNTLKLPGMQKVVGLADIHPGRGAPVGAAFLSDNIHPYLIGSDIGCGMQVILFDKFLHEVSLNKLEKKLYKLESFLDQDFINDYASSHQIEQTHNLGSIGLGNHFVEILAVTNSIEYKNNQLLALIHTGSRHVGKEIVDHINYKFKSNTLSNLTDKNYYLNLQNKALSFAFHNRNLIAIALERLLNFSCTKILDINHNFVETTSTGFLHRKGAAPTGTLLALPGTRGTESFLVSSQPLPAALNSAPHGAGRKIKRGECKARFKEKFTFQELKSQTRLICESKYLVYEEAPLAYKNIATVLSDSEKFNLVSRHSTLKPIITYKTACCD